MKKILKKLMDEYKFCCIHADADDTVKFSYGKVIGLDDYFAALYCPWCRPTACMTAFSCCSSTI